MTRSPPTGVGRPGAAPSQRKPVTISLDVMSGDNGPDSVISAALSALDEYHNLRLILVGDEAVMRSDLQARNAHLGERLQLRHASQTVEMCEAPSKALRNKKDSSMRVAIDLVKDDVADACVSAGNTGALMAIARFVLKTLPGIDRPAIISAIPSIHGHTHMLDLGANAECQPEQLFQFAVMGSVLATAVDGLERPRVGLLNIGEEEIKGNENVRDAGKLLQASTLNYIGFVEGDDIYVGDVDVVVCDGFVGNVALKTSEGLAKLVSQFIREEFSKNVMTRFAAVCAMPILRTFRVRTDPRNYNGASFLGLQGTVIKSHGGADAVAFKNAIRIAILEVEKAVPDRISHLLASTLGEKVP